MYEGMSSKEILRDINVRLGHDPNNPPPHKESTEKDFYKSLERPLTADSYIGRMYPHILIVELMRENGVTEGHPMYKELTERVQRGVASALASKKSRGWTHPRHRIPLTKLEFTVNMYMTIERIEGKRIIPKEYDDIFDKFRPNHNSIDYKRD